MNKLKALIAVPAGVALGVMMLAFAAVVLQPATVHAHEGEDHSNDTKVSTAATNVKEYAYTAQAGDSYSKMARKAIQTYGINNKVNLSGAQIIFAETTLTLAASSPVLNLGQKVTLTEASVKDVVEKAQKLTDAQKTAWNYYAQFVDFNTNNVGQARS